MVDLSQLPAWAEIYSLLGEQSPRRKRGRCSIHGGDSLNSVSLDEDKGVFFCHVCHSGGDKIDFVQLCLKTDFQGALRFLGIEPGKPPKPDPASLRRKDAKDRVREWIRNTGRRLRDEYLCRQRISHYAEECLAVNLEDETAWELLRIAFDGEAKNEFLLDEIDLCRTDDERLRAWRLYRHDV